MFLLLPVQNKVFGIIAVRRKKQLQLSDARVRIENEVVTGMRIVKLNGWEPQMLASITAVRNEELAVARNLAYINAFVSCLITTLPTLVAVSAFTLYSAVMHGEMASYIVFPALSLFNQLRFPIMFLPRVLSNAADALVSLKRLQRYLGLPDAAPAAPMVSFKDGMPVDNAPRTTQQHGSNGAAQGFSNAGAAAHSGEVLASIRGGAFHFGALPKGDTPFLRDINLELRQGTLTVVVGAVGAGKTALAAALLGELTLCAPPSGAPRVTGRVAYVAQSSWVQSVTLKENVLFGLPFDAQRYEAAIEAACLGPDIALLPAGHDTEIGERGITLSGGQRARVAIARAVYADADVYVLDDPIAALDAHVGRAVFHHCVRGVLRAKAVMLITHALAYAADADTVLLMEGGRILEAGPFATLMAAPGGKLAALMAEHGSADAADADGDAPAAATVTASGEEAAAAPTATPAQATAKLAQAPAKMIEVRVWPRQLVATRLSAPVMTRREHPQLLRAG
jgi:ABC-type multidrug transport system fused ATPase/permease subunit